MKVFDNVKQIIVTVALLAGFVSTLWAIDGRYAKQDTLVKVEVRLDQKILTDQYHDIRSQIWDLEDRYYGKEMPEEVRVIIRELKAELAAKKGELDTLEVKK